MQVLKELGYSESNRFVGCHHDDLLPANELTFVLRHASAECSRLGSGTDDIRFDGAYVLQRQAQAPAVPVVFVMQVKPEATARRVHQLIWNLNQTPFLVVDSPATIRIYPGFSFERDGDHPLISVTKDAADVLEKLAAFRAESIDDGTLWRQWAHAVDPSKRVNEALLRDLKALDDRFQKEGVRRSASHGLIGTFVYLRYLRDRAILSNKKLSKWGIQPDHLFTRKATLKAFRKVNEELQQWLNGSVFSLGETDLSDVTASQLQLVASVFRGDSPVGKEEVQQSLFDIYNFAHIPIETLSCVYEQFLHDAKAEKGRSRGKSLGAYYTPLPLADYVLSELESRRPLTTGMKTLDPACGSGSFLVQCYRRLIEKQRRIKGRELTKTELRDLLTTHIYGIDRDDDACRIAELSLILTLLDYVQPPDLENTSFKLPCLRGQNIFGPWKDTEGVEHKVDFFDTAGPVFDMLAKYEFDWIVGNPPWVEVKGAPQPDHEHYVAHQWIENHKTTHPMSGRQIAEAFLWKAGQHLARDGVCGLVVPAMTWFKKEATTLRQRFFSERRVWCLANFANLAYVLFAGRTERPASVVFFDSSTPDDDQRILTFAPFVAEQIANRPQRANRRLVTWNIVVSGNDVRETDNGSAKIGDPLTWKLAMWGTARDRKLLQKLERRFQDEKFYSLRQFDIDRIHQGLELRTSSANEDLEHHPELENRIKLLFNRLKNIGRLFAFPEWAQEQISAENCYVRKGRANRPLAVCKPPHVVVDSSRRFCVFLGQFAVIPHPQIGIAGSKSSERALRALSVFLSSNYCTYHQFLTSPTWGIDVNRADLSDILHMPIPLGRLTSTELDEWAELQRKLASVSKNQFDESHLATDSIDSMKSLLKELNDSVYKLLGIKPSEQWLIEDFVHLQIQLTKGKVTRDVLRPPTTAELIEYLTALRDCLDGFLTKERGLRHKVEALVDPDLALVSVALTPSKVAMDPDVVNADEPTSRNLKAIRDQLRNKHSQWVYFERALKIYEKECGILYQFKPLQWLHWTRRQAVLDADDIIAETLTEGEAS